MNVANEFIAPLARLINTSFDTDKDAIIAFDSTFDDPFEANWQDVIAKVEALIFPEAVTRLMTGQKDIRNAAMTALSPMLTVLAIRIKAGVENGTITQTLKSFMLDKLNASINKLSIVKFNVAFTATITQVLITANAAALDTLGFTIKMQDQLSGFHKKAMSAQGSYTTLKISRKNLSPANLLVLKQCYDMTAQVCVAGVGTFSNPLVTEKVSQYTISKAIDSVRPTPVIEPRDRHIAATKSMCLKTNPVKKDTFQMTLTTQVPDPIYYCMCDLKTGVCTTGGVLEYNKTINILQKDIPGSDAHLVISNSNLVNIVVKTFTIIG